MPDPSAASAYAWPTTPVAAEPVENAQVADLLDRACCPRGWPTQTHATSPCKCESTPGEILAPTVTLMLHEAARVATLHGAEAAADGAEEGYRNGLHNIALAVAGPYADETPSETVVRLRYASRANPSPYAGEILGRLANLIESTAPGAAL